MTKRIDVIWLVLGVAATILGIWLGVFGAEIWKRSTTRALSSVSRLHLDSAETAVDGCPLEVVLDARRQSVSVRAVRRAAGSSL